MASTTSNGVARALRTLSAVHSIPAILERLDRLEHSIVEATQRIDELQGSVAAIGAVRTEVRDLTEHLTEELNAIAESLAAGARP